MTDPNPHSLFGQAFLELQFYALNSNGKAFTYGADYPSALFDYHQGFQFTTTPQMRRSVRP